MDPKNTGLEEDFCWSILVFGNVFLLPQIAGYFGARTFFGGWDDTPRPKKKNQQGQLLTSDNYDDNEKKVVGGRNGQGPEIWGKNDPDMVSLGEDVLHAWWVPRKQN